MTLVGRIVPSEVHATIKREIAELTHDELVAIASGARAITAPQREEQPSKLH
jgi:hypothetical protein